MTDSVVEIAAAVNARRASAEEVVGAALARIRASDERIHAYLRVDEAAALGSAREIDARVRAGTRLPLAGVPIALKDAIATRGVETTCASRMLRGWVPPYDATVVERLRQSGAVITGKTNMDEFAMGSSTENSAFGPTRNPWDEERVPGGSSGGSAAAVAANLCAAALGSDTGGSIRQPAAMCGVVGIKPTYGRVSRFGLVAFASSLDQIGPLARSVEDAALVLEATAGHDPRDSTSDGRPTESFREACRGDVRGLRVGVPREFLVDGIEPGVQRSVRAALDVLASQGVTLVDVSLPHSRLAVAAYYLICTAEASANLARFDGVRYGHRAAGPADLHDMIERTRGEGFGPEVKRRILLGTYVLSSGYYDAYYAKAQKIRTLIRDDFAQAFSACDLLATPTTPTPAFRLGEHSADPLSLYLADVFTIAVNLAGLPAMSLPCGILDEGLPVGLQFIAPAFSEARMLRAAWVYEQAAPWRERRPPLWAS